MIEVSTDRLGRNRYVISELESADTGKKVTIMLNHGNEPPKREDGRDYYLGIDGTYDRAAIGLTEEQMMELFAAFLAVKEVLDEY